MKRTEVTAVVALCGAAAAWGQIFPPAGKTQGPGVQAAADAREADYLKTCKVQPQGRGGRAGGRGRGPVAPATFEPKDYVVTGIAGVIAAGAKWTEVWHDDGNNADGIIATKDGGVMFSQNDESRIVKIDKNGKVTYPYTGLETSGSLLVNSKGELFVLNRVFHPYIEELSPQKKVVANKDPNGDYMDCIGGVLNDAVADSKGGIYFSMNGLYYAAPDGSVTKQDAKGGNPPLATNGIILTPDEKHVVVTNAGTLVSLDVGPDGQLNNQRKFANLDTSGLAEGQGAGGFDADGRLYVSAANGIQVFDKDGKHLGNIPAQRGMVSVAISGPQRKTMYTVTAATVNGPERFGSTPSHCSPRAPKAAAS